MIREVVTPEFLRERALELEGRHVPPPRPRPLDGLLESRNRAAPFIPRDPEQSLLQSALEEGIESDPAIVVEPAATDDPCGPGRPDAPAPRAANEKLAGPYGPNDFGWLKTKVAELKNARDTWAPFSDEPVSATLAADARVLLVSDWGTGLRGAEEVGIHLRAKVQEAAKRGTEVHVVHLGDVYYCGTPREYARNFLEYWPVQVGDGFERVYSWNVNGNHDMYSGGHGYFELIAGEGDPRAALFKQQGGCSYFRLANDQWRIYGLDTAYYKDQDLGDDQLAWIRRELRADGGKAILLSHHQLASVYDRARVNGVLRKALDDDLKAGRVRAWFWGHEHRCIRYRPYAEIEYPRCIGNGGVPEVTDPTPFSIVKKATGWVTALFKHRGAGLPPRILSEDKDTWPADGVHWRRHGFVCLDLRGAAIKAAYIDQCGTEIWSEDLM